MKALLPVILAALATGAFAQSPVTLQFRTGPSDAVILIDGAPLALVPAPNGGRTARVLPGVHQLTVSAPGYRPSQESLTVKTSVVLERKLEAVGSPLSLVGLVATGQRPKSVEFTPDGRFLVVAPLSGRAPEVFDAATLTKVADLAVPAAFGKSEGFVETVFLPENDELWISQMHNSKIHVFRLSDFSYVTSFASGGSYPKVIFAHPNGRVFVSQWVSKSVTAFDPVSHALIGTVKLGFTPRGLAASNDGRWLYVSDYDQGSIAVVDAKTLRLDHSLFTQPGQRGAKRHLVVDPVKNRLYATDLARGSLFVVDLATETLVREIRVGASPNTTKLSDDGRFVFVSTRGHNNAKDYEQKGPDFGTLVVIDTETLEIAGRQFGGNQPTGLAVWGSLVVFTDFLDHRLEVYRFLP